MDADGISSKFIAATPANNFGDSTSGEDVSFRRLAVVVGPDLPDDILPASLIGANDDLVFGESAEIFARVISLLLRGALHEDNTMCLENQPALLYHGSLQLLETVYPSFPEILREFWVNT